MRDINILIEKVEIDHCKHRAHKKTLQFTLVSSNFSLKGNDMNFTLAPGFQQTFAVSPFLADGVTPSKATLSNLAFTTNGTFTATQDPSNPLQVIVGCPATVASGATDTCIAVATATEPDGVTTEQVSGTLSLTAGTGTVVAPAASLGFAVVGNPVPLSSKK